MLRYLRLVAMMLTAFFLFVRSTAQHSTNLPNNPEWSRPYAPYRIVGNIYYVGTYDLASYLITGNKGHILINTGLANSAEMIRSNVEALGFRVKDIKVLLATHVHFDHVAAMAALKKLTGAQLMIEEADVKVMMDGGNSDYAFGGHGEMFKSAKVDRALHDGDTVLVGTTVVRLVHHPGHTPGASSYLLDVKDSSRSYRVLIANMPSIVTDKEFGAIPEYPEIANDYAKTLASLKAQQFDIWLASHASQFGMHRKHHPGDAYRPEVFMDRPGYDSAVADLERRYFEKVAGKK